MGDVIYVNLLAEGDATGTSWPDAYQDLQSALLRSQAGDEIWVARGCYQVTSGADREVSFSLVEAVSLYGGFMGSEVERTQRNPIEHLTVLDGDLGQPDVMEDNTERIVTATGVGATAILDGFTIQHAYNDVGDGESQGGGVYAIDSSFQIANCVFQDNIADGGAGIWAERGGLRMVACVFLNNENSGVTYLGGTPTLDRCLFSNNRSHFRGGGFNGGTEYQASIFNHCAFLSNSTDGRGGAYFGLGDPAFVNCVFVDNKCGIYGGTAYLHSGSAVFINCSVFRNRARMGGGGIVTHNSDSTPSVVNCLLWGNRSIVNEEDTEDNQIYLDAGTIDYSCVEGWSGQYGGVGNFGDDPRFVDSDKENLRLRDDSPCFDAGDDSVVTQSTDLDGNPRILGARVDIGCYESLCPAIAALDLKCTNSGKLKATATTTLPEGATVRFTQPDAQGRPKPHPAAVNRRGKAVAKWRPDSDAPVCIEGCSQPCTQQACP